MNTFNQYSRFAIGLVLLLAACGSKQESKSKSLSSKESASNEIRNVADSFLIGRAVFEKSCIMCHTSPESQGIDEMQFASVLDRLPSPSDDYFIRFITNSRGLKQKGDNYAMKLEKSFSGNDYEHFFVDSLSQKELYSLITFIKVAAHKKYE